MPTYEYACKGCGHTFEIVQKMADDALTICPECGGELRKVFAPPAIAFKGSGFYATDHGKKARTASGESSKGGAESSKSDDTAKGPDTKTGSGASKGSGTKDAKAPAPAKEPSG